MHFTEASVLLTLYLIVVKLAEYRQSAACTQSCVDDVVTVTVRQWNAVMTV